MCSQHCHLTLLACSGLFQAEPQDPVGLCRIVIFSQKDFQEIYCSEIFPVLPEVIPSGILSGMFSAQAWCLLAAPALGTGDRGGKISCALRRAAVQWDADKPVTEHHHR